MVLHAVSAGSYTAEFMATALEIDAATDKWTDYEETEIEENIRAWRSGVYENGEEKRGGWMGPGMGLQSSTSQLNLSHF